VVWRELLLAVVGEQLSKEMTPGDAIQGVTISVRDRYCVCEVWNKLAESPGAGVMPHIKSLMGPIDLSEEFYKCHNTHKAFSKDFRSRR